MLHSTPSGLRADADLFGRHDGPAELAQGGQAGLAAIWGDKRDARGG